MTFMKISQYACLMAAVATMTACGGGGGSSDDSDRDVVTSMLTVPTAQEFASASKASGSFNKLMVNDFEKPTVDELIEELGEAEDTSGDWPGAEKPDHEAEAKVVANPEPVTSTLSLIALTAGALAATRRRRDC